jgi:L-ascorbate metabolism protein UlaG (beta-lactamase superfamily)
MKAAFQTSEQLLKEVRQALTNSERKLWWLGQSGFLLVQSGRALLLDPYLSDSLTRKYAQTDKPHVRMTKLVVEPAKLGEIGVIDVITSSHGHTDHLDAETLLPLLAANPHARLVIPAANRDFVLQRLGTHIASRLVELDDGTSGQVGSMEIQGVASAHPTVERDDKGRCRFLGYVVQWDGLTLYHSGDTLLHESLIPFLQRFRIDIALLPINGDKPERRVAGNLNGREAAQLAKAVGAKTVIPCHYDLFEFNTASPDLFIAECVRVQQAFRILGNGEGLEL